MKCPIINQVRADYNPYEGQNRAWKTFEDSTIYRPKDAVELFDRLRAARLIPKDKEKLLVVDATANRPTHALAIHQRAMSVRQGVTITLAGDINAGYFAPYYQIGANKYGLDGFSYYEWNASNLPIETEVVDLLFDRKGWLWHCAKAGDRNKLESALEEYRRVLKARVGCLIIDDNPYIPRVTESTAIVMQRHISRNIFSTLSDKWDVFRLFENKKRVIILKKK